MNGSLVGVTEAFLTDQGYFSLKERTFSLQWKRSVYPLFIPIRVWCAYSCTKLCILFSIWFDSGHCWIMNLEIEQIYLCCNTVDSPIRIPRSLIFPFLLLCHTFYLQYCNTCYLSPLNMNETCNVTTAFPLSLHFFGRDEYHSFWWTVPYKYIVSSLPDGRIAADNAIVCGRCRRAEYGYHYLSRHSRLRPHIIWLINWRVIPWENPCGTYVSSVWLSWVKNKNNKADR